MEDVSARSASGFGGVALTLQTQRLESLIAAVDELQAVFDAIPEDAGSDVQAVYVRDEVRPAMDKARDIADVLERTTAANVWPLPISDDLTRGHH